MNYNLNLREVTYALSEALDYVGIKLDRTILTLLYNELEACYHRAMHPTSYLENES